MVYNISMPKDYKLQFKESSLEKFNNKISRIFVIICLVFLWFSLIANSIYSEATVFGRSMMPTLNTNFSYSDSQTQDTVILNHIKTPHKGDIIVVKKITNNQNEGINVIKRLIAIEGDKIKVLSTGQIVLNGEILQEDYVNTINREILYEKFYGTNGLKIKNPDLFIDDELFVPKNHIFYLGDNRGESEDCASYGPIHKKYLIARVDYVIKAGESKAEKI